MLCDEHKQPAVFFSNQLNRYMCFKCLMDQNNLLYIDKTYKNVMEEFLRIRDYSKEINKKNQHKAMIVQDWKKDVRAHLMQAKKTFNQRIDKYIDMFSEKFKHID